MTGIISASWFCSLWLCKRPWKRSTKNIPQTISNSALVMGQMDRPQSICHIQCDVNEAVNRNRSEYVILLLCTYRCTIHLFYTKNMGRTAEWEDCVLMFLTALFCFLLHSAKFFAYTNSNFSLFLKHWMPLKDFPFLDLDRPCSLNILL